MVPKTLEKDWKNWKAEEESIQIINSLKSEENSGL